MPAHRRISQGVRTSGSASSNFSRTRDVILFTFYWPSIATELVALGSARNHHWVDWFGKIWKRNPVDWTEKGICQNNPGKSQRFPHEQHSKWHYHSSPSLLKTNESPEDSTGARTVGFQKSSPLRSNMGIRFGIWRDVLRRLMADRFPWFSGCKKLETLYWQDSPECIMMYHVSGKQLSGYLRPDTKTWFCEKRCRIHAGGFDYLPSFNRWMDDVFDTSIPSHYTIIIL